MLSYSVVEMIGLKVYFNTTQNVLCRAGEKRKGYKKNAIQLTILP
jgi:hypothetical protein